MAHMLELRGGKARMFVGENFVPWHGLGTVIPKTATAREALNLSGLGGWDVQTIPLTYEWAGKRITVPDRKAVLRGEDGRYFATVGADWEPVQNETLVKVLDTLREGGAEFMSGGSLCGGRIVWLLTKNPDFADVEGDKIDRYIGASNGHDGSHAVHVWSEGVVVVCANTHRLALKKAMARDRAFRIVHSPQAEQRIEEALQALTQHEQDAREAVAALRGLRHKKIAESERTDYFRTVARFHAGEKQGDVRIDTEPSQRLEEVFANRWEEGRGQKDRGVSWYRGLNAVTDAMDHVFAREANVLEAVEGRESVFRSCVFGDRARTKSFAFAQACVGAGLKIEN